MKMNEKELAEVFDRIHSMNDEIDFEMISFCVTNGYGMQGALIKSEGVDISNRKTDLVDMVGYMLANMEIKKSDIILTEHLKGESKNMLLMIKNMEK